VWSSSSTGTTPTATKTYAAPGTVNTRLRVTDDGGNVGIASLALAIGVSGVSSHSDTLLDTPGLVSYWRMGDATGPTIADSKSTNNATAANGPVFGAAGGVPGDSNTAVTFDGVNDSARANLNLSGTSVVSVEFWLKWNRYADDDALAMEFTDNFNGNDGGFLIDPDAPQLGGTFGVGLGRFASRNNVFFPRPTAGVWHHYTFVFDTTAPGATQITPYVDGAPVSYTKLDSGTGGGPFANAALNFMSRGE